MYKQGERRERGERDTKLQLSFGAVINSNYSYVS